MNAKNTALTLSVKTIAPELSPTRAEQIEKVFIPMQTVFRELDAEFKNIVAEEEITPMLCAQASTLRKKYVKVRTGADEAHKAAKENIIIEGRAIDGLRNIIKFATTENEEKLKEIEEHFERKEQKRLADLLEVRSKELFALDIDPSIYKLTEIDEASYASILSAGREAFAEKKRSEAKAEEDRIAKAKAEAEEAERMRAENEQLKLAAEAREKELAKERAKAEEEKERVRKEAEKLKKAHEDGLQKEREAREKVEAELKAKADAEAFEALEKAKAEKIARLAPDKEKLEKFASSLIQLEMPSVTSPEANAILLKAQELLLKTSEYILSQSKNI